MLRAAVALSGATALVAGGISAAAWLLDRGQTTIDVAGLEASAPSAAHPVALPSGPAVLPPRYSGLFDPRISGRAPTVLSQDELLGSNFEAPSPVVSDAAPTSGNLEAAAPTPARVVVGEAETPVPSDPTRATTTEAAPLPLPRPQDLGAGVSEAPGRLAGRQIERPAKAPAPPSGAADTRSFIQKLFGIPQSLKSVLAYSAPEDDEIGGGRIGMASPPWTSDRTTAVYNIAAHTVTLPNGAVLEAHSGLGNRLDDPRYVAEPNRGATPPHVYDLEPRAQLFHGVQALRLNPVGGGGVFGRTGLLAHTFMLGPNGDSNGCVSFRNYNAFLQAYQRGEVKRLVVVAGRF